jgi:hypothetical protein
LADNGEDEVADPVPMEHSAAFEHNDADMNVAEPQEAADATPTEGEHRPANKSAFG